MNISSTESSHDYKNSVKPPLSNFDQATKDAGKKVGSMASDFANSTSEYVQSGRSYVKQNPATGVAIAAAAGAVVGSLVTLAMRKKH